MTNNPSFVSLVRVEIDRARAIAPGSKNRLLAFVEESGELVQAVMNYYEGKGCLDSVLTEAIHSGATLFRLIDEGDSSLNLPPVIEELFNDVAKKLNSRQDFGMIDRLIERPEE